jgi:hypothetical protein
MAQPTDSVGPTCNSPNTCSAAAWSAVSLKSSTRTMSPWLPLSSHVTLPGRSRESLTVGPITCSGRGPVVARRVRDNRAGTAEDAGRPNPVGLAGEPHGPGGYRLPVWAASALAGSVIIDPDQASQAIRWCAMEVQIPLFKPALGTLLGWLPRTCVARMTPDRVRRVMARVELSGPTAV